MREQANRGDDGDGGGLSKWSRSRGEVHHKDKHDCANKRRRRGKDSGSQHVRSSTRQNIAQDATPDRGNDSNKNGSHVFEVSPERLIGSPGALES